MNKFMNLIGIKARKASEIKINTKIKNKVLNNYALLINKEKRSILRENKKDIKRAPMYNEHTENILRDRLNYSEEEIQRLKDNGVIT